MKQIKFLFLFLTVFTVSCNYLDIVPDNNPTMEDAFKRPGEAQNFLFSLYSFMPAENDMFKSIGLWGTDEMVTPWDRSWYYAKRMMKGELNANDPFFDYWTTSGDIDLYDGIRQGYIFLENVDNVQGLDEAIAIQWKAEAKFLIAYYHFILLRQYGPVVLMEKSIPLDAPDEEFFPTRKPYDQCVDFIVNLLDEAAEDLPETISDQTEYGKPSAVTAKSIKARLLLYAASPLFNGNAEFYSNFKNKDGEALMNTTYQADKWNRAATAIKDAIDMAEGNGVALYNYTDDVADQFEQYTSNYRYMMVDGWNKELIWGYSIQEGYYGWQRHSAPANGVGSTYNGQAPTMRMVEAFYTKDGLPMDVDPDFDYNGRYNVDGETVKLHIEREPRFYATIGYDRGDYEINNGVTSLAMRFDEAHGFAENRNDYSPTGYLVKKGVHPNTTMTDSKDNMVLYPWPIIRLAELYLNYAEALNEANGAASHTEVIRYLDDIRERSGVPGVLTAWQKVGKSSFTKEEMREIIRTERTIELCYEGHRCWDVRRWKMGEELFNTPVKGWNINGSSANEFYQVVDTEPRVFNSPGYYLFPIKIDELEINTNLVQNPGW
ncbi:RagB/SusD family nutrient uptake outer membrane protein [Carboxylicivirga marina]|uniref:RagB/SusD family nutrient uptake outer membrane protein n=1 Tax=Carboxylicivirga marina TaxID=2800988 RepID=A0ABS1HEW4_9BACT|nr:RagB/SusD family nutrient uptake outer membrane protein [Carboxylicivirga marina]MBK3516183.1 RagB/SusD family nutrient uptake outer membrane protein [Carboxylicivirga marina]